jgi:hypothetical protein
VVDAAGNVRATTGRRHWIAQTAIYPYDDSVYPAAVDCGYPWDFGQCDASDESALPSGITALAHDESRDAYC